MTAAGATFHTFTHAENLAGLHVAQQTAWKEYFALSPTTASMLREVVQTLLEAAIPRDTAQPLGA